MKGIIRDMAKIAPLYRIKSLTSLNFTYIIILENKKIYEYCDILLVTLLLLCTNVCLDLVSEFAFPPSVCISLTFIFTSAQNFNTPTPAS